MRQRINIKKILGNSLLLLFLLITILLIGRVFFFDVFRVSSDSMYPLLSKDDKVIVLKTLYGPRLLKIKDLITKDTISFYRMPGVRDIKRNDIVVFNFPYKKWNKWDNIELQYHKYYVKRCIGLPGDSISIRNCTYSVLGCEDKIGDRFAQEYFNGHRHSHNLLDTIIPYSSHLSKKWTVFNMGPFYIPKGETVIAIDTINAVIYKNILEWESKKNITIKDGIVFLGNDTLREYKFISNYYFMAGDNVSGSIDSRFWGVIPEEFIHGIVWTAIKSKKSNS